MEEKGGNDKRSSVTSKVPAPFNDPSEHADSVTLIVQGTSLYASKGALAMHSPVLRTMFFNDYSRESREGVATLDGKKLEDVVAFLRWLYRLAGPEDFEEDPDVPMTMATTATEESEHWGIPIAVEDIVGLLALADEWQVKRLKADCHNVFWNFFYNVLADKKNALLALPLLEAVGLTDMQLDEVLDSLISYGVTMDDVRSVGFTDAFRLRLYEVGHARTLEVLAENQTCFHCREEIPDEETSCKCLTGTPSL